MPLTWINGDGVTTCSVGRLGTLVVRRTDKSLRHGAVLLNWRDDGTNRYQVIVFGLPLERLALSEPEGKAVALETARRWVTQAAGRLQVKQPPSELVRVRPAVCPKAMLIHGCDWPDCDCDEPAL